MIEDYPGGHKYKTECLREGNFIERRRALVGNSGSIQLPPLSQWDAHPLFSKF
jgi:hypothetical protein